MTHNFSTAAGLRATAIALGLALGGAAGISPAMAQAQVLQLAVDGSPAGLEPHIVTAFTSFQVVNGTLYEGLTAIDKDLRVVPAIAQSWTVSPDGKTYVFKLVSGATFHDGKPVEAADVVSSLNRCCRRILPRRWQAASAPSTRQPQWMPARSRSR